MTATPWDRDTEFELVRSDSPVSDDGYKIGEPKALECAYCSARVRLTPEPSAGVDDLPHDSDCPQRWVRSQWWRAQFAQTR